MTTKRKYTDVTISRAKALCQLFGAKRAAKMLSIPGTTIRAWHNDERVSYIRPDESLIKRVLKALED